ncbi:MAG: hypothetical protein NUV49_04110, partial [Patescibacteria group bacterium]|nr:hypothetical protein [Patescibacteria group bacterium]
YFPSFGTSLTTISSTDTMSSFPTTYNANLTAINNGKLEASDYFATTTHATITSIPQLTSIGTQTNFTSTYASSTQLSLSGLSWFTGLASFDNSTSTLGTLTTGWATNFYPTYASSTALTATTLYSTDSTLTAASTTNTSASQSLFVAEKRVIGDRFLTQTYATSSVAGWTSTTTLPSLVIPVDMTLNSTQCVTDTGTLNVQYQYASTFPAMLNASTTKGTFTFSSNNTPSASDSFSISFGTPASSPTEISCTARFVPTGT